MAKLTTIDWVVIVLLALFVWIPLAIIYLVYRLVK